LTKESNVGVEIVVGKIHQVVSGDLLVKVGRALGDAGEGTIGRRERSLPHMGELVKDVGVFDLVCVVIHEDNDTLLRQDHFGESRPLVEAHRNVRRLIQVVGQIRLLENIAVVSWFNEVAVDNEECHDIVGMVADPSGHFVEFFEVSASIQKLARGVATKD
jgi:hypothetical protein